MIIVGVIIAGGRSARFGAEKTLVEVEGRPMIAHMAAVLRAGCTAIAVNAPVSSAAADWARAEGLALLPDPDGLASGPLAGVVAGLTWADSLGATALATVPCDMPWLPADLIARLTEALSSDAGAAMAVCGPDRFPLTALWKTARRSQVAAMMADGRHPSMRAAMAALDASIARFEDTHAFTNVNAAEDLAP